MAVATRALAHEQDFFPFIHSFSRQISVDGLKGEGEEKSRDESFPHSFFNQVVCSLTCSQNQKWICSICCFSFYFSVVVPWFCRSTGRRVLQGAAGSLLPYLVVSCKANKPGFVFSKRGFQFSNSRFQRPPGSEGTRGVCLGLGLALLARRGCQLFRHHIVKSRKIIIGDKLATPRNKVNFSAQILGG